MIYNIQQDGVYFNESYQDFQGGRQIYTRFQNVRKRNRKYFVYNLSGQVVRQKSTGQIQIIQVHRFDSDLLTFYFDMYGRMSFMIVRNMPEIKLYNYLAMNDLKPRFRLFHMVLFQVLIFFGFFVVYQDTEDVVVQIGYTKALERKIHFLFPKYIRQKFVGKKGKIPILFQFGYCTIQKKQLSDLYVQTSEINVPLYLKTTINQTPYSYHLKYSGKENYNRGHYLFATRDFKLTKKGCMFIRKSVYGQIVLVHTTKLSWMIKFAEKCAYICAKVQIQNKKYDIYFEKFCHGANESGFYMFQYAMKQKDNTAYYVLSKTASNYQELKKQYGSRILKKNSFSAFYHIFRAQKLISSDLPTHIQRRLYDNSKLLKQVIYTCQHKIFLQHGVSLATNLFARGYYNKRVPIAPNYIVVSSERERQLFLKHSLYRANELWHTGVPNLDFYARPETKSVKDEITFLLTWRPWDLHGVKDGNSYINRYFQFLSQVQEHPFYNGKKVNLILHPKAKTMLETTYPKQFQLFSHMIYDGDIYPVLMRSKVVVSDYSSVVFYAFAGGSNIVFFWGDKQEAEKYYGSQNFLQAPNAFGEICYKFDELTQYIVHAYNKEQEGEYQTIFQTSVDCLDGLNAQATYKMIQSL